jgi:chromate transporter
MNPPSIAQIAKSFLRLGITAYGGPAMVVNIKRVVVGKYGWMEENDFQDGIALCQLIPGATAFQMSAYAGYKMRGAWGAFVACTSFILPAFVLMVVLSAIYLSAGQIPLISSLFMGLRAIVVAIIAHSAFNLGKSSIKSWQGATIAAIALIAYLMKMNVFLIILLSGSMGLLLHRRKSDKENINHPENIGIAKRRRISIGFFLLLVAGILFILLVGFRVAPQLARMGLSLMKIGSVAFGGGYTMIPLIQAEVVSKYNWLTTHEFIDGIAMGQITPGPIVITATFIGYKISGILGAVISTISVFLPSFLILLFFARKYEAIKNYAAVKWILSGVLSSFISMLIITVYNFGIAAIIDFKTTGIAMAALVAMFLKVDMAYIIIFGMVISMIIFR